MNIIAAVVLAGSIAMPPVVSNSWAVNDWAPLKAEYAACADTAPTYFSYYVCTTGVWSTATTNAQSA